MAKDYGLKIAKSDKSIESTDKRDLLASSQYSMFKYHMDVIGTVTFTPGDTYQEVSFDHNLGYVPAFIAYYKDTAGKLHFIPSHRKPTDFLNWPYAYADRVKVKCGYITATPYNQYSGSMSHAYDEAMGSTAGFRVGKFSDDTARNGAVRFTSVSVPQGATINSATLRVAIEFIIGDGSGSLIVKIAGIDEDNTADFSSNPMGRTQTTNTDIAEWPLPAAGNYLERSITTIVQEIISRAGWSSGNAMGFLLLDAGGPNDRRIEDDLATGINTQLVISYGDNTTVIFRAIIFKNKIA